MFNIHKDKQYLLLLFLICSLYSCSKQEIKKPDFIIRDYSISYRGTPLQLNENVSEWIKILGKPSRHFSLAEEIYVWDNLGVFCYYDSKSNRTEALAIAFGNIQYDFWPKYFYEGCISIDNAIIDKNTLIIDFNKNKTGEQFREGYFPSIYHYYINRAYVRLDLNDAGNILQFSISKHLDEN